jgi:hypothetical protein
MDSAIPFSGGDERSEPENADYGLGQQGRDGDNAQRGEAESESTTTPPYRQPIILSTMARGRGSAARQGRPPRPFLVIIAIAALVRRKKDMNPTAVSQEGSLSIDYWLKRR